MINSIIEAISIALNAEFGDDYTTYTEEQEQGLKEPCFFISTLEPTHNLFRDRRYFRRQQFCIQFFPANRRLKGTSNSSPPAFAACAEK